MRKKLYLLVFLKDSVSQNFKKFKDVMLIERTLFMVMLGEKS